MFPSTTPLAVAGVEVACGRGIWLFSRSLTIKGDKGTDGSKFASLDCLFDLEVGVAFVGEILSPSIGSDCSDFLTTSAFSFANTFSLVTSLLDSADGNDFAGCSLAGVVSLLVDALERLESRFEDRWMLSCDKFSVSPFASLALPCF